MHNNKRMEANQDQQDNSFDSSQELDQLSLTESTISIPQERPRASKLQTDSFRLDLTFTPTKDNNQVPPEKFSMSKAFVGFRNGWGKNEIKVNQSKLKRAKKFFDDTQVDQFSGCNTVGFGAPESDGVPPHQIEEFSMPCFKTMGTGEQVKISQAAKQKASSLFRELQSIKKPTKVKKASKITTQSLVKTFNVESKFKMEGQYKINLNRKSFNWEEYEKQFKDQIEKDIQQGSKKKKRKTQPKRKNYNAGVNQARKYIFIKLYQLTLQPGCEIKLSETLASQARNIPDRRFYHNSTSCSILQCVFCKIHCDGQELGSQDIYSILNKEFSKKWVNYDQFQHLYLQVCFKLLKYQTHWPEIINKRCNLSNIVIEINKKLLQAEKVPETSFLKYCITNELIGKRINLIVQDKYYNQKMGIVFVKLSDGWTSVWAAIEEKNILFKYVREGKKVKVGTKLALCLWSLHPISNILDFCPLVEDNPAKCIQFFYNGSVILHPNAKLGHINEEFYRPLNKCRAKGGLIPVIEGAIIRLFSSKINSKKGRNDQSFQISNHYAQILTVQGYVCLVKFSLNEENSLVEYFRLYYSYRLSKVKINEENCLSFLMNQSRIYEVKSGKVSQKEQIYPQPICNLLSQRLLNIKKEDEWEDGTYDVLCKDKKVVMKSGKEYEVQVEGEAGGYSSLYQQVRVERITNNFIKILKDKRSSQLRKFPKIYDKFMQSQS